MPKQKKVLLILFCTLLLDMIGSGMVIPIIPIIFTDPSSSAFMLMGYSTSMQYLIAGAVTAIFGIMQFVAAPLLGELSDIYGRKKLLALGVAVLAIGQMLFGFGIGIASLWILFISRAVAGFAGANFSIAQAAIADVTEPQDRAKNFGLIGAAFGIGFILGPFLGGWIADITGSASAPFWFSGILGILNLVFLMIMLPETNLNKKAAHHFHIFKGLENIKKAFEDRQASPVYWASFLYMSGFAFFTTFIGILAVSRFGLSAAGLGTFFAAVGVWVVITQLLILPILSKKYSERAILRTSLLVLAVAIGAYPFLPSALWLYVFIPLIAIPQGLSFANIGALISKSVSSEKQGAALGINGSLIALSQGLIPLLAGVGSGLVGLSTPFVVGSFVIVFAWSILFFFKRKSA